MNLFCLKNIEITTCNNYYISCKMYFGFSYLHVCTWFWYHCFLFIYLLYFASTYRLGNRNSYSFKPSSLVRTSRRTQTIRNIHNMSFNVIWLLIDCWYCCKFSYSFQVMIVYCLLYFLRLAHLGSPNNWLYN